MVLFDIGGDVLGGGVEWKEFLDQFGLEGGGGQFGLEHQVGLVQVLHLVQVDLVVVRSDFRRLVTHGYKYICNATDYVMLGAWENGVVGLLYFRV